MVSIKDIAKKANVSIATVSHVINKTRYVSPELENLVRSAMQELNYHPKKRTRVPQSYKATYIGIIYNQQLTDLHQHLLKNLQKAVEQSDDSYYFCLIPVQKKTISANDLAYFQRKMNLDGLIISLLDTQGDIKKLLSYFPIILISLDDLKLRNTKSDQFTTIIQLDLAMTIKEMLEQLNKKGHVEVTVLLEKENQELFFQLITHLDLVKQKKMIANWAYLNGNWEQDFEILNEEIEKESSAFIAMDEYSKNTLMAFQGFSSIKIPNDYSFMYLAFDKMSDLVTHFNLETPKFANYILQGLAGYRKKQILKISGTYVPGKTLAPIAIGPNGEKAYEASYLHLTNQEINRIKKGNYSVGICFHQSDTLWSKLHEKGMRDIFESVNVPIVSVMNANFNASLQNEQHKSLLRMKVDAIVSIPVDEKLTASSYREIIDSKTKLVLITNVPNGVTKNDYVTCISVNEQKNGAILAQATGEYMHKNNLKYLALINHGASFFATQQRDQSFKTTIEEDFLGIEISGSTAFHEVENVEKITRQLINRNPLIQVIYVCWEGPARKVLKVLREMNRTDIKIFTTDLDTEIAKELSSGENIIALSTQKFYEQGRAMALATLCGFISKAVPPFIAIEPTLIKKVDLEEKWELIAKEKLPLEISELMGRKIISDT